MAYLSSDQVTRLGLAAVGSHVSISDRCSIYGADRISIGDHARIDDFVVVTAAEPVVIGSYVHISAFAFLGGQFGIEIEDFANVSIRVTVLSGNDDFSGHWLPGPHAPADLRQVEKGRVRIGRLTNVGAHSVVLPGVTIGEGAAIGALSLVKTSLEPWGIYGGIPARFICERERYVERLAQEAIERLARVPERP